MVYLTKYSHDRKADFGKSSDDLFDLIEEFGEQDQLIDLFEYFQRKYSLPKDVIKQKIKNDLVLSYKYKKARFREELSLIWILFSIVKFMAALIYALVTSKKYTGVSRYKLIVDDVSASHELHRFSKLINLFENKNVLVVATNSSVEHDFPDYNVKLSSTFKYYDRSEVIDSLRYELFSGIWLYVKVSIKLRINLIPVSMHIIKDFLCYKSLFNYYRSDYLIQERHYKTSAIKNHLFKNLGGIATSTIQKNILQIDQLTYYIDIDYFFALGNRTAERAFKYGARIDRVIATGSMFMEHYWFSGPAEIEKNIDVVMFGINTMNAYDRIDSYAEFMDDYYNSIQWLVRFKKEHPSYRIAIKHHPSAGADNIENEIISASGVEMLDKSDNSYKIAFSSRCAVTFGSTMGYELNAHGIPTFFFDPGYRCTFLPDREDNLLDGFRVTSYESFCDSLLNILDASNAKEWCAGNRDDLCLESSDVSERIYSWLNSADEKNIKDLHSANKISLSSNYAVEKVQ